MTSTQSKFMIEHQNHQFAQAHGASPSKKIPLKWLIAAMDDPCDCFLARWTNCRTAFTGNGGEIKTAKFQV